MRKIIFLLILTLAVCTAGADPGRGGPPAWSQGNAWGTASTASLQAKTVGISPDGAYIWAYDETWVGEIGFEYNSICFGEVVDNTWLADLGYQSPMDMYEGEMITLLLFHEEDSSLATHTGYYACTSHKVTKIDN